MFGKAATAWAISCGSSERIVRPSGKGYAVGTIAGMPIFIAASESVSSRSPIGPCATMRPGQNSSTKCERACTSPKGMRPYTKPYRASMLSRT